MSSPVAFSFVVVVLVVGALTAYAIFQWSRHHAVTRMTRVELTSSDEYRRLSEMAITTQEHVDLRLTDLSVQVDSLRDRLDQMQRILKEVE